MTDWLIRSWFTKSLFLLLEIAMVAVFLGLDRNRPFLHVPRARHCRVPVWNPQLLPGSPVIRIRTNAFARPILPLRVLIKARDGLTVSCSGWLFASDKISNTMHISGRGPPYWDTKAPFTSTVLAQRLNLQVMVIDLVV